MMISDEATLLANTEPFDAILVLGGGPPDEYVKPLLLLLLLLLLLVLRPFSFFVNEIEM